MDGSPEELTIVRRIFVTACHKFSSAASFADFLDISYSELAAFLEGEAMPSNEVLLRAVDLILDDVPSIKREFSKSAWEAVFGRG